MRKLVSFIAVLFVTLLVWSSTPNVIVEHYTVEQGLPNNVVNCTLKDKDGFIWFGTWYGLCRFDGQKFYTYNKQQSPDSELPPRKIQHIVEDKNQNLWLKTIDHKLFVFDKQTELFHAVYDDMKNYSDNIQVVKMQTNASGEVLLLTLDRNLLLAEVNANGEINIRVLYDSKKEYNAALKIQKRLFQNCWKQISILLSVDFLQKKSYMIGNAPDL